MVWRTVQLGEVLRQKRERTRIEPGKSYKQVTVRLWGKGLTLRGTSDGSEIAAESQVAVAKNDFLISKIDARHGAFGLVPADLEGAVVSTDFPCFTVRQDLLDPRFLEWFSKTGTFVSVCRQASTGSTNRVRLKEDRFLSLEIPLPSLDEQQKIAERFENAKARIVEATNLLKQVAEDRKALLFALLNGSENSPHPRIPFGQVAKLKKPDVVVEPDVEYGFAGVYSFGKGVFEGSLKLGSEFSYRTLTRIRQGEFIYPKLMAWEGALGVVPECCDGLHVSPEFPVFSINSEVVYPEIIDAYFKHPSTWPNLGGSSKGTNLRRRRLHPGAIQKHQIPLPPRPTQNLIRELVCSRLDDLHEQNKAALEALIPAMLHQIFERQANTSEAASTKSRATVVQFPAKQKNTIDTPFREAVLVGAIVKAFYKDNGQPIGNFRLQKAVYFARRQMGESALEKEYLRKAAGPYNPTMRYSGGIKIAMDKNWIKRATGKFGEGSALGDSAPEMDEWIERYQFAPAAAWVRDRFKYKSNDLWEAFATIDYAMLALDHEDIRPTSPAVLSYIAAHDEWRPKIEKLHLTEASIQNVMVELEGLFPNTGG